MTFEEYRQYDALGLAELVRTKAVHPTELLETALARLVEVNPKLNAVIDLFPDRARQHLAKIRPDTPFSGVPFLIKDLLIELSGTSYRMGSRVMGDYRSPKNSWAANILEEAGFSIFGKTNLPELGLTVTTEPERFGATRNPWSLEHSAGGSSGGSAVAVASGIVPMASGGDGGGSIRIPAANCHVFGMKPSRGRISFAPLHGEIWNGAVVDGCLSRSVRDSAAYLDLFSRRVSGEPYLIPLPKKPYRVEAETTPPPMRIAYFSRHPFGEAHPDVVHIMNEVIVRLQALGHTVEEVALPYDQTVFSELQTYLVATETAADLNRIGKERGKAVKPHEMEPSTYLLASIGRKLSAAKFVESKRQWNDLSRKMGELHTQFPVLLTPVLSQSPAKLGALSPTSFEETAVRLLNRLGLSHLIRYGNTLEKMAKKLFSYTPYTPIANLTGQPAMSVPAGFSPSGLPIGCMFTAAIGDEATLFRLAGQWEHVHPWFQVHPPELTT
ncbi:MAG: amidase [Bacteroidetes Order II. Incertae sedis bacterium]|nr:amidase [Bacteroidetes Order II. bacterium]